MVKLIVLIVGMSSFVSFGQDLTMNGKFMGIRSRINPLYRNSGTISASATFTPGVMLNRNEHNYYLSGFAEYHINRTVSVRGESYFHLNGQSTQAFVHDGIRTFFGAFYHLNRGSIGNWDVRLGFQPGITVMRKANYEGEQEIDPSNHVVSPSFSTSIGFDYYVWRYFHFFTIVAYVNSTMRGLPNGSEKTDELLISAGLGFQIQTKRAR